MKVLGDISRGACLGCRIAETESRSVVRTRSGPSSYGRLNEAPELEESPSPASKTTVGDPIPRQ